MKKPWLAFALNLIPGVGLAYLGRWGWAALNFVVVQAVLVGAFLLEPIPDIREHFHWLMLVLAALSAGLAHRVAEQVNQSSTD